MTTNNRLLAILSLILALAMDCVSSARATERKFDNPYLRMPAIGLARIVKYSSCTLDSLLGAASGIESGPSSTQHDGAPQLTLFNNYADLLSKSNCISINRAVEAWDSPPDFTTISNNIAALHQQAPRPYVFGINLAEHISLKHDYYFPDEGRNFAFKEMCASPPKDGDSGCYASFARPEYQKYISYVGRKSIETGIQVLLFGGAAITDNRGTVETSGLLSVLQALKRHASDKGISVVFVAQTPSSYGGRAYIDAFDLILGGVYINSDGTIPDTPKVTNKGPGNPPERLWLVKDSAGHPYYDPQKLVIEYDWFGNPLDDTSELACLAVKSDVYIDSVRKRDPKSCPLGHVSNSATLVSATIYTTLKRLGVGFWLPGRQPIAFAPWDFAPFNLELYKGDSLYAINFNEESLLSIAPIRGGTRFNSDIAYHVDRNATVIQRNDGRFCFGDGDDATASWCLGHHGNGNKTMFTEAGELVQTDARDKLLWSSKTRGRGITLEVVNHKLSVLDDSGRVIWAR
jgi:hypothetical protein